MRTRSLQATHRPDVMINDGIDLLKQKKAIKSGDTVLITAGAQIGVSGTTNLSEIRTVR